MCGRHASVAAALLAAGAQVLHASVSFETPLYIAALRGHVATVDLLLDHYRARGLHWQVGLFSRASCSGDVPCGLVMWRLITQ